ncbi:hypothetical protein [Parafrankia elaeagni]|uniref:hypothetical protein n=1 Tax=Parafrankia elaeagni TaxID=222534 RepID=UPI000380BFD2|nr:hypothetical protein [Parafrankia elaeagni]
MTNPRTGLAGAPSGSTVSRLLAGLFDDAALFPPGNAPMDAALAAYRFRPAGLRTMVARFVVPAARLGELVEALGRAGPRESPDPVALVVTTPAGELPAVMAQWSAADADRARALFTSFGTCGIAEPAGDLVALGLLRASGADGAV